MRKILVTGAAGQIGSELVVELRKRYGEENVVATDLHLKAVEKVLPSGPNEQVDVTDIGRLREAVERWDVTTIYHLAAILSAAGEKDPKLAWDVNMKGLLNVLDLSKEIGVKEVYWPSSIAVFGPGIPRVGTPQDVALTPTTMYGITKVAGEQLCNYYFAHYGLDVRSIRYPGIISSKVPPQGGTTDYAVDMFYQAVLKGRYTCFVRADTVLPMMYMPDAIRATIALMEASPKKVTYHMGHNLSGISFSAGELAEEIKKHVPGFRCEFVPDFRQKIADSWPESVDDGRARNDWGWKPKYDLASMTEDMIKELAARAKRGRLLP
ncbi:MAG: NAD-dependent epimerase/dehydratase family protein [Nitrososphaerota archaeon]|nr:NAD-dependent epimerase/dehydratase family protein [Nitrososphaerota archaeon]MDG6978360.1 NAD-dependent epimerase/dehydratase family protein [Nitrososphaerota archaeon]MDG7022503.1 NAD-dependent epimerase/dehydratase family protein [Nitrososphaerota archaeon]